MRNAGLPDADADELTRSAAACFATILELPAADVPCPAQEPWTEWRGWLARRGLGMVPVAEPAEFSWAGPWIALLPSGAVVAFGVPSGIVWRPLGGDEPLAAVRAGFVVAPLDVALWRPAPPAVPAREQGTVELIAIASAAEAPMQVVDRAEAIPGRGLRDDRYATGEGTFGSPGAGGHDLTLVEAEQLDGRLELAAARRNVVTRGIDLNPLVGRRFTIGDVECLGQRLCEPCAHLERLTEPGVLRALVHKAGLRADIVRGGEVVVGAPVRPC